MTTHRPERVADQIQRVLARLLQGELRDPRVGFVTLTAVHVTADLRHARVWVTVLGEDDPDDALRALRHAAPFLRRALAREAGLRFTPELTFAHDAAGVRGRRVEEILRELDVESAGPGTEHPEPPR